MKASRDICVGRCVGRADEGGVVGRHERAARRGALARGQERHRRHQPLRRHPPSVLPRGAGGVPLAVGLAHLQLQLLGGCLLYTSDAADDM
eukprot:2245597-Rhodomonas_salina.1